MRAPRPRVTVRGTMVAVAIAAMGSPAWLAWARQDDRRQEFSLHAWGHREEAELYTTGIKIYCFRSRRTTINPRKAEHHAGLARKYEWAARHPWLPVLPDPPEPE